LALLFVPCNRDSVFTIDDGHSGEIAAIASPQTEDRLMQVESAGG
jgi:hypothetical protein